MIARDSWVSVLEKIDTLNYEQEDDKNRYKN